MSPLANVYSVVFQDISEILPRHSSQLSNEPRRGLYGNSPRKNLSWTVWCSSPLPLERVGSRFLQSVPLSCDSHLANWCE